jgi:hypothetical protein
MVPDGIDGVAVGTLAEGQNIYFAVLIDFRSPEPVSSKISNMFG